MTKYKRERQKEMTRLRERKKGGQKGRHRERERERDAFTIYTYVTRTQKWRPHLPAQMFHCVATVIDDLLLFVCCLLRAASF